MIGFYDSGVGGKRIAEAFHIIYPEQEYQYYQEYLGNAGYQLQTLACPGLADAIEQDIFTHNPQYTQSQQVIKNSINPYPIIQTISS